LTEPAHEPSVLAAHLPTRPPIKHTVVGARSASAAHWVGRWA
jgi:hypothetical protein